MRGTCRIFIALFMIISSALMTSVFICGCGNKTAEYKQSALNILSRTEQNLEAADDPGDAPPNLDAEHFVVEATASAEALSRSLKEMRKYQEEFDALEVPESASSLHEEILEYYYNGITVLEGAASLMSDEAALMQPFSSALKVSIDTSILSSDVTPQEIQSIVEQLQGSLAQLNDLELSAASEDIAGLKQAIAAYIETEIAFFSTFKQLLSSWSQSMGNQFDALAQDTMQKYENIANIEMEIASNLEDEFKQLEDKIEDLKDRIYALE